MLFGLFGKKKIAESVEAHAPTIDVQAMENYVGGYDGNKFAGGYGETHVAGMDYYALRERSAEMFETNLYARGLIRRLVTNEINVGIFPEVYPNEQILGVPTDSLDDWSEDVEARFGLWAANPKTCDFQGAKTFAQLQDFARMEALVGGDMVYILREDRATQLPNVELIRGDRVMSPMVSQKVPNENEIVDGVELDKSGRHVAYWIKSADGTCDRVPCYGPKTGRLVARMIYGTDRRLGTVRGVPLLGIVLQSMREIDRYRDAATRKAVINSILAMFIKKTEEKMGTRPISASATRYDAVEGPANNAGEKRSFNMAAQIPGTVFEELQTGEEPVAFGSTGTDVSFGPFEAAMVSGIAWSNEIPPEILTLAFSSNYSASQAALHEFRIYLFKVWKNFGSDFCQPILKDWFLSEVLRGRIEAPGYLEAWKDPAQADISTTWTDSEWYGSVKPSTDPVKQAKASAMLVSEGWSTNAREARILTGTKFSKNIKRVKRENQLKAEAAQALGEFKQQYDVNVEDAGDLDA